MINYHNYFDYVDKSPRQMIGESEQILNKLFPRYIVYARTCVSLTFINALLLYGQCI